MAEGMNGALLALGVVGAVAAAGRVARGSFNTDPRPGIKAALKTSKRGDYVDSGDLVELLEQVRDSEALHSSSREMARELLDRSEEDEYLDTGEAIEVLEHALREAPKKARGGSNMGSLAKAGENKAKTEYRSLYHGHRKKAHNLFPWNLGGPLDYEDDNRRRQLSTRAPANKQGRAGGSRAVGVDAHNPKSRAEYIAYLDDLAQRARNGKLTLDEHSRWSYRAGVSPYDHHTVAEQLLTKAVLKNIATEREWISTWSDRNPGTDRGSRAFTLDDPEYTHYVVHTPSMKIASGWSYAEDAKEALADMGGAKSHCKVYTRKYLRDNGRDPRHNGSWASRGQF